jgi:hypothetical protein
MSLFCDLGWHRPAGLPRWNDGYYFSRCGRCGRDLVRTAYQKWHVPQGYRVVWCPDQPTARAEIAIHPASGLEWPNRPGAGETGSAVAPEPDTSMAPAPAAEASLSDSGTATAEERCETPRAESPAVAAGEAFSAEGDPPGPARGRLPISEVLDHLKAEEAGRDLAPHRATRRLQAPSAPERAPAAWSDDFMKDDPGDELVIGARHDRAADGLSASGPAGSFPSAEERELLAARLSRRARLALGGVAAWVRRSEELPPRPGPVIGSALAISAAIALAVIVISPSPSRLTNPAQLPPQARSGDDAPEEASPLPVSEPSMLQPQEQRARQTGIVIAGVLSCRSAPSMDAARIRNLLGGQQVEIVARTGDWLALAQRNGQCWAQARFVSPRLAAGG